MVGTLEAIRRLDVLAASGKPMTRYNGSLLFCYSASKEDFDNYLNGGKTADELWAEEIMSW